MFRPPILRSIGILGAGALHGMRAEEFAAVKWTMLTWARALLIALS